MALTYQTSSDLMNDQQFIGRVKVACLKFANFINDEAASTAAHNTRFKWAQMTLIDSDAQARKAVPTVVMDPAVQTDGTAITDANLQSAVENALQKLL